MRDVEDEVRELVEQLVRDIAALCRAEALRGFGVVDAVPAPRPAPNIEDAQLPPPPPPSPRTNAERVLAFVADNSDRVDERGEPLRLTAQHVSDVLGIAIVDARSLVAGLVRGGQLQLVGDRHGLPNIVLGAVR